MADDGRISKDIRKIKKALDKAEADLTAAHESLQKLHGLLERCAVRHQDTLGVEVQSVIPKDPD